MLSWSISPNHKFPLNSWCCALWHCSPLHNSQLFYENISEQYAFVCFNCLSVAALLITKFSVCMVYSLSGLLIDCMQTQLELIRSHWRGFLPTKLCNRKAYWSTWRRTCLFFEGSCNLWSSWRTTCRHIGRDKTLALLFFWHFRLGKLKDIIDINFRDLLVHELD